MACLAVEPGLLFFVPFGDTFAVMEGAAICACEDTGDEGDTGGGGCAPEGLPECFSSFVGETFLSVSVCVAYTCAPFLFAEFTNGPREDPSGSSLL